MQFKIPTLQGVAQWRQRVTLDGSDFLIDFAWNGREGAWYISISDADGDLLLAGRKLVTNRPLLSRFRFVPGLPIGELFASDLSGAIDYAGFDQLGAGVELYYLDAAELLT